MVQVKESTSSDNGYDSSKEKNKKERNFSVNPKHVQDLVISMLLKKSFIGKYTETRFVESLHDYKDLIQIAENDPIIPILSDLHLRLRQAFPHCWPGSTLPSSLKSHNGYCFWVDISDKVFDPYHYRIADICFREKEIRFVLEAEGKVISETGSQEQNIVDYYNAIQQQLLIFALAAWQLMTLENLKNSVTFCFMLICTLGTAGIYLMDYLLKFMNELTKLIRALTPFLLKCLDIVQKVLGAFFLIIATIWRDLMGIRRHQERARQNYLM